MAAHALTIARQILTMSDEDIVRYAEGSLPAPGWDSSPWSSMTYHSLHDAVDAKDPFRVRQYACQMENEAKFLETYGLSSFERYSAAIAEHVRIGTSWWRMRLERFFAGTLKSALDAATPESIKHVQEIVPEDKINRGG